MRRCALLVCSIFLTAGPAAGAVVSIPDSEYYAALKPGDETDFNQIHMACKGDRVAITFGEDKAENRGGDGFGRGALETAFADCRLDSGASIRVKAGYRDAPMSTGECGSDPEKMLSIWIGRRKIVSQKKYTAMCSDWFLKSVDIDAQGATICTLGLDDHPDHKDFVKIPEKGSCEHVSAASGGEDKIEFVAHTLAPGTFVPEGRRPALCRAMVVPGKYPRVAVPARFARPKWSDVPPHENTLDETKLGFDATTLAKYHTRTSRFDLENTGHVQSVYQHDQDDHWFAGSALANARPGILDVPFDAHNWDRSRKSGIYAYVYDHVTVFFDRGRTYLLLDPANPLVDPRIVTLRGGKQTEVCRLVRQQENF